MEPAPLTREEPGHSTASGGAWRARDGKSGIFPHLYAPGSGTRFAFSVEPGLTARICGIPHITAQGRGYMEFG